MLKVLRNRGIEPHIPVFDKSACCDGCFERAEFIYDRGTDSYCCPGGKTLVRYRQAWRAAKGKPCCGGLVTAFLSAFSSRRAGLRLCDANRRPLRWKTLGRGKKADCDACALKPSCCPKAPMRKVTRHVYEGARDMARDITRTDAYVVSSRARDEFHLAATA